MGMLSESLSPKHNASVPERWSPEKEMGSTEYRLDENLDIINPTENMDTNAPNAPVVDDSESLGGESDSELGLGISQEREHRFLKIVTLTRPPRESLNINTNIIVNQLAASATSATANPSSNNVFSMGDDRDVIVTVQYVFDDDIEIYWADKAAREREVIQNLNTGGLGVGGSETTLLFGPGSDSSGRNCDKDQIRLLLSKEELKITSDELNNTDPLSAGSDEDIQLRQEDDSRLSGKQSRKLNRNCSNNVLKLSNSDKKRRLSIREEPGPCDPVRSRYAARRDGHRETRKNAGGVAFNQAGIPFNISRKI